MNAKQAENLRILADHMERITRVLDMENYHNCGTPACAMGEAASMERFQQCGLLMGGSRGLSYADVSGHWQAASDLFGLSDSEVRNLFGISVHNYWRSSNVTGQEWATVAREILVKHGYGATKQPERIGNLDPALSDLLKRLNGKEVA